MAFSVTNTAVVVPLLSLTPTLAPSYDGRTTLTAWRMGFSKGNAVQSAATVDGLALAMGPVLVAVYALAAELTARLPVTREAFEEAAARTASGDSPAA